MANSTVGQMFVSALSDEDYASTAVNNVQQAVTEVTGRGASGFTQCEERRLSNSFNRLRIGDLKSLLLEKVQITSGNKKTLVS